MTAAVDALFDFLADFRLGRSAYFSCKACGALVYEGLLPAHARWHANLPPVPRAKTATTNSKETTQMAKPTVSLSAAEAAATAKALSGLTKKSKTIEKVIEKLTAVPA